MFFSNFDFSTMLTTALLGMLLALFALAILLLALHLCGVRLFWKRQRVRHREKAKDTDAVSEAPEENELSEEELIVILTAAATQALGGLDTKRFRVVAFRRI